MGEFDDRADGFIVSPGFNLVRVGKTEWAEATFPIVTERSAPVTF